MHLLKKPNTCEKGGGHLRISFWHLFMNLKNKLLLKKLLHFFKKYIKKTPVDIIIKISMI